MDIQKYTELLSEKLTAWADTAVTSLPNLVVALLCAVAFGLLSRPVSRLAANVVRRMRTGEAIAGLISAVVRTAVVLAGVVIGLGVLGLDKTIYSMLAGAGVVGLALGFAFQDVAANLIAGVFMGFRKPFAIGDLIETNDYLGYVVKINLRNTLVRTFQGQTVLLPNKEVFENPLVNYSTDGQRRVDIDVGVAYDTDLEQATQVAREAVAGLDVRAADSEPEVVAQSFGGSSIDLSVRYWIPVSEDVSYPQARHAGVLAVKRAFDEAGIEIPFPIRTLEIGGAGEWRAALRGSEDAEGAERRSA